MEEVTDMSDWSPYDQKNLLIRILLLRVNSIKQSYKAVESSLKWEDIMDGKSAEECKTVYKKLISKVRKDRTMQGVISDAILMITDETIKPAVNEQPDSPKKPLTAFSLFVKKRSKKFPDMNGISRMKVFASEWNELSEEKKEVYKRKYRKLKKKYDEELDIFRQNHPDYQASTVAPISRPQPPLPSKLFVQSKLEKIKSQQPELSHEETVTKLTDKYKNLSDKKKLRWIKKARNCVQTYQDQCELYIARHPRSSTKVEGFHLSEEEQRIWQSSRGKPVSAPPQNLFMYFCDTRKDGLLHLTLSEQSRKLSAICHTLTEDELKDLKKQFKQEVEEYVNSYTQYYQSLSEGEKSLEQSPEDALAVYYKILQKDQKKKKQKKQTEAVQTNEKQIKLSDLLPQTAVDVDISHDYRSDSPPSQKEMKRNHQQESVILDKKKKKKKSKHHTVPPKSPVKENHTGITSPSTNMSAHNAVNEAAVWSFLETETSKEEMADVPPSKVHACDKIKQQDIRSTQINQHPDLPRRPLTAFSLFVKKRLRKCPGKYGVNRMKVFASEWNELSEEKKEVYKKKYMKLKKKYEEKLEIFRQNHSDYQISSIAPTSQPQVSLPSKLFVESRLEAIKSKQPELSHTEAVEKLMDKYQRLSDKKKLKWINIARDCVQTYQEQCEQYLAQHPKSSTTLGEFHLSKEVQRVCQSSRGKPASAPPQNLFMYFCDTRKDGLLHLPYSEQSKELSAMYHTLTEYELKDLEKNFIKVVAEYIISYTQYYKSLSEEEKGLENSPEDALAVYYKTLQKYQRNKKKKQQVKDTLTEDNQEERVISVKRKSPLHDEPVILQNNKKKKNDSGHDVSPSSSMKENHINLTSPHTNVSVHDVISEADPEDQSSLNTEISEDEMIYVSPSKTGTDEKKMKQKIDTTQITQVTGSGERNVPDLPVNIKSIKQELDCESEEYIELKPFLATNITQEQEHKMFNIKNIKVDYLDGKSSEIEIIEQPELYGQHKDTGGQRHHQRLHTGEKPYKCDVCGVFFSDSGNLKKHQRTHTGEKPYKCDICGTRFTQSGTLKIHKRRHTGEKPYKCDVCGTRFSYSGDLRIHQRRHTGEKPYKCDICGSRFVHSGDLKNHQRIHTGEKPYKCDICGTGFSRSGTLKIHKRRHTGEKPYNCDICKLPFYSSGEMKKHQRAHT